MAAPRRPPMPKLPPFALTDAPAKTSFRPAYFLAFFLVSAAALIALHVSFLNLPFFWDEQGQFIPTALDLLRKGLWVARSTVPNVHPPGVEVYLVIWYKIFGFSILVTRIAMLVLAGAGLFFTFLLAIELSHDTEAAPAFLPPLFLIVSPLFYMQCMMAQLDMPAMVFTVLALLLFLKERYVSACIACVALVMVKETGLVVPAIFGLALLIRKHWRGAALFAAPGLALAAWLILLRSKTGYWLGDPGFAHYNVGYALEPIHIVFSLLRRVYYLFFAEFRWIGTLALILTARQMPAFRGYRWKITLAVSGSTLLLVSVLGGAELERYLLPVLPVFYIAVSISMTLLPNWTAVMTGAALVIGLVFNLFWNPPYPFPYENNLAMVDFVRLQQAAARYAELELGDRVIATAWPYSAALRSPDYGYVHRKLNVIETDDFHTSSIKALPHNSYDALITYTRTWEPRDGVLSWPLVKKFLSRFYDWEPQITPVECEALGLSPVASWSSRGQEINVYIRPNSNSHSHGLRLF